MICCYHVRLSVADRMTVMAHPWDPEDMLTRGGAHAVSFSPQSVSEGKETLK